MRPLCSPLMRWPDSRASAGWVPPSEPFDGTQGHYRLLAQRKPIRYGFLTPTLCRPSGDCALQSARRGSESAGAASPPANPRSALGLPPELELADSTPTDVHSLVYLLRRLGGGTRRWRRRLSFAQGGQQLAVGTDEVDGVAGGEQGVAAGVQLGLFVRPGDGDDTGLRGHLEHPHPVEFAAGPDVHRADHEGRLTDREGPQ